MDEFDITLQRYLSDINKQLSEMDPEKIKEFEESLPETGPAPDVMTLHAKINQMLDQK